MTAAIIGVIGAVLGAAAALISTALSDRRHAREEQQSWFRDQRTTAYDGALRYLLRARNRRSTINASSEGGASLSPEHHREWFDDLVEAQFWVRTLSTRCSPSQAYNILRVANRLDEAIDVVASGTTPFRRKGFEIWDLLNGSRERIARSARYDSGRSTQDDDKRMWEDVAREEGLIDPETRPLD
jgi:hypothetical protein